MRNGYVLVNGEVVLQFDMYAETTARKFAASWLKKILRQKQTLGEIRIEHPDGKDTLIKISEVNL